MKAARNVVVRKATLTMKVKEVKSFEVFVSVDVEGITALEKREPVFKGN